MQYCLYALPTRLRRGAVWPSTCMSKTDTTYTPLHNQLPVFSPHVLSAHGLLRDGTKPCEMKKRSLLFATKVGGQLYMCEGGRKEKGGRIRGSMSLRATSPPSQVGILSSQRKPRSLVLGIYGVSVTSIPGVWPEREQVLIWPGKISYYVILCYTLRYDSR